MNSKSRQKKSILAALNEFFDRKTIKGFANRIAAIEDLDLSRQEALRPLLGPGGPPRLILFAPAQSMLAERQAPGWWPGSLLPWQITPERTLVLTERFLLVVSTSRHPGFSREARLVGERNEPVLNKFADEAPVVTAIALADILYLEMATVLLNSWTEIAWVHDGRLDYLRIHYNTVSRSLFEELASQIRPALLAGAGLPPLETARPQDQGLERLAGMPYKFRSLNPLWLLLPGEPVLAAVFRPSIWSRQRSLFNRHIAAKMALVRTDGYLIIAQEDLTSDEDSHGLVSQFCPLSRVRRMALNPSLAGQELVITLSLHGLEHTLRRAFPPEAQTALQDFVNSIVPN
jgi:hypothetical protein